MTIKDERSGRGPRKLRCASAAAAWLVLATMTARCLAQDEARPLAEQGYAGLALRDIPGGHTVVSWIFPGPLKGEGLAAPAVDLARPDLIVSIDGESTDAAAFKASMRRTAPGTTITIKYRRSLARGGTIPTELNHEEEVRTLEVVLDSRDVWTGTIGRERGHDTVMEFNTKSRLDPLNPNNLLGEAVAQEHLVEPLTTLLGVFPEWADRDTDFHSLSRVRAGFDHPFRLEEIQKRVTSLAPDIASDPLATVAAMIRANLDAAQPLELEAGRRFPLPWGVRVPSEPPGSWGFRFQRARDYSRSALGFSPNDEQFARQCIALLRVPGETFYISGEETQQHVEVIRRSMDVDYEYFATALELLAEMVEPDEATLDGFETTQIPVELAGAVQGEILYAGPAFRDGWLIVGSAGDNSYDMTKVEVVIDPGGNDRYFASDLCLGNRAIIDFTGNDHYSGTPDQGPAGALFGISLIDDRAGDDRYEGEMLACGAGMFGVGVILDRAGNDVYSGKEWSLGAACYGAGMIIDLGNGADTYLGEFLCQGVGGPRGFGAIIDEAGRDLYRANGPKSSAYGTPAVYQSFSQGIGFGFRNYAAGGIGLISDLAGDDRYEAGEFAQGGAYYYGLGILHDASGRDLYYGNRYAQGFGVHQAMGVLADEAGDDTYWCMTAAGQGAAWDIGAGLLIDYAGNDSYQADGLAQGGASMQGIALLIDLGGDDRYNARGGATQGQSGGDSYHYHETGAYSFSLLLDLGGGSDLYSRGRANDAVTATGAKNDENPQNSSFHGLVIDR